MFNPNDEDSYSVTTNTKQTLQKSNLTHHADEGSPNPSEIIDGAINKEISQIDLIRVIAKHSANIWKDIARIISVEEKILKESEKYGNSDYDRCETVLLYHYYHRKKNEFYRWSTWKELLKKLDSDESVGEKEFGSKKIIDNIESDLEHLLIKERKLLVTISNALIDWETFAMHLGLESFEISAIKCWKKTLESQCLYTMIKAVLKSTSIEEVGWCFFRKKLSLFEDGRKTIKYLETCHSDLCKAPCREDDDVIYHLVTSNHVAVKCHHYDISENFEILKYDEQKLLKISTRANKVQCLNKEKFDAWLDDKQKLSHQIDFGFKVINYSNDDCPVMKTLKSFLQVNSGFAFKGFGCNVFPFCEIYPKTTLLSENILAYLFDQNILLHITFANKQNIREVINNNIQTIRFIRSAYKSLQSINCAHISVVLFNETLSEVDAKEICSECSLLQLIVPKKAFEEVENFKRWYNSTVIQNEDLNSAKSQLNVLFKKNNDGEEKKIQNLVMGNLFTLARFQKKPLHYHALNRKVETNDTDTDSVMLLTPQQFQVLNSEIKHCLIHGCYGSGKSVILQKKLEYVLKTIDESDIVFYICHDKQSEYTVEMKEFVNAKSYENVIVCNSSEMKCESQLSSILNNLWNEYKGKNIHVFIEEFNFLYLNGEEEINKINEVMNYFKTSYVVVACQAAFHLRIGEIEENIKNLSSATSFQEFPLDVPFRNTITINHLLEAETAENIKPNIYFIEEKVSSLKHSEKQHNLLNSVLQKIFQGNQRYVLIACDKDLEELFSQLLSKMNVNWTNIFKTFFDCDVIQILITNTHAARGYEFDNVVCITSSLDKKIDLIIGAMSRAKTSLHMILVPSSEFNLNDKRILSSWLINSLVESYNVTCEQESICIIKQRKIGDIFEDKHPTHDDVMTKESNIPEMREVEDHQKNIELFLDYASSRITNFWKKLGRYLNVSPDEIDDIEIDNVRYHDVNNKARAMLCSARNSPNGLPWERLKNGLSYCYRWDIIRDIEERQEFKTILIDSQVCLECGKKTERPIQTESLWRKIAKYIKDPNILATHVGLPKDIYKIIVLDYSSNEDKCYQVLKEAHNSSENVKLCCWNSIYPCLNKFEDGRKVIKHLKEDEEDGLQVMNLIASHIADWKHFGKILGMTEPYLERLRSDHQTCEQRNKEIMKKFSYPFDPEPSWSFWCGYLRQFDNGKIAIADIEQENIKLLAKNSADHSITSKNDMYIGHPYEDFKHNLRDSEKNIAIIQVPLGTNECTNMIDYQEFREWVQTQQRYVDTYNMLKDLKTINFTDNYSPILETLSHHLTERKDIGFAIKGYNFVNAFCLFKKYEFPKSSYDDTYFSYFANDNVILFITECTAGVSCALYHSRHNIKTANSLHEMIRSKNILQVNVIVHSEVTDEIFCKQCIDKSLFVNEGVFTDTKEFSLWYENILKIKEQLEKQHSKSRYIMDESQLVESLKNDMITYQALETSTLPSFSHFPEDQMEELKKLVILSPNQYKALHSNHKHILLRGSYGSGKSLVLFKKFEQILSNVKEADIVYFICHDQQSKLIDRMKFHQTKFPSRNIIACRSDELTNGEKLPRLSTILTHIRDVWKGRIVHVLIDEFNGAYINRSELPMLKELLLYFQNCYVVVALQSMEQKVVEIKEASVNPDEGYQLDLLTKETSFTCYNLDYSLRNSVEINNFVKATSEILEFSNIPYGKINYFKKSALENILIDNEQGMEKTNTEAEESIVLKYKYNQCENIGHSVSSSPVNIYHCANYSSNTENDIYRVYLATLMYILKGVSTHFNHNITYVICTYDEDLYNVVHYFLYKSKYIWTDNIELLSRSSDIHIVLTDYASIRGFEFENLIVLLPLEKRYLKYRLIEVFTRATTFLQIICDDKEGLNDFLSNELVENWRRLDSVNFFDIQYNKTDNIIYFLGSKHEIFSEADVSQNDVGKNNKYPWNSPPAVFKESDEHQVLEMSIGLECVVNTDNIALLNEYNEIHKFDRIKYRDDKGNNLLHSTAKHNANKLFHSLLKTGEFDINSRNTDGATPIHMAAVRGDTEIVDMLVLNGADINIPNDAGRLPLHEASFSGNLDIVKYLLKKVFDINVTDFDGKTPLHLAAMNGHANVVKLLIENEADVNVKDKHYKRPYEEAKQNRHDNIVQLLLGYGYDNVLLMKQ